MFKLFKGSAKKNEVKVDTHNLCNRLTNEEFDALIESYKKDSQDMREECIKILEILAYQNGKSGFEMDFEDDTYKSYSDIEILRIKNEYHVGKLDRLIDRCSDTKNELKEVREGVE